MDMKIEQAAQPSLENNEDLINRCNCESDIRSLVKRVKRLEILAYIITFLIALSIIVPLTKDNINKQKALPANIDTLNIIQNLQAAYNNKDNEKLYNILGDYAKSKVSYEQMVKALSPTTDTLGKMTSVTFSNYTYMGNTEGADWYLLKYAGVYESGSGSVDVTIRVVNGNWEITAYYFRVSVFK